MKRWTSWKLAIASLALVSLLAACAGNAAPAESPGGSSGAEGEAPKEPAAAADANFNAEGYPIVNEPVTLRMTAFQTTSGKHYDDYLFFQEAEKTTNVKIDWDLNPGGSSWAEKKSLMFASGDLPDAFFGHGILDESTEVVKYGSQGILIPLEELIDQYAPNVKALFEARPDYKKALTSPDGHIYALPTINETYARTKPVLFINQTWLDHLGLEVPKTTEEFYNVLKAFKTQDPNGNGQADEIPFTFRNSDWNTDLASMFGAFGLLDRRDHILVEDGKVVYTAVQPEYKEAIQYFHRLFSEGLADPEGFTQDASLFQSKISKNDLVGAFVAYNYNSVGLPEDHDFVLAEPLIGPNGDQMWAGFTPGILFKGSFAITSVNPHPEVTIRWIDYMYDPLISLQAVHGMIGVNLEDLGDGTYKVVPPPEGMTTNEFREAVETSRSVWAQTEEMAEKIINENQIKMPKNKVDEVYAPYLVYNEYPKVYFTAEENSEISRFKTDIGTFVDQKYAEWMLNGGIDAEWDSYIDQLHKMGLERMLDIYQTAYDRYMSAE